MPEPRPPTPWGDPKGLLQIVVVPEVASAWVALTLGQQIVKVPVEIALPENDPRVASHLLGILAEQMQLPGNAITVTAPFRVIFVTPRAQPVPWQDEFLPETYLQGQVINVDALACERAALLDLVRGRLTEWPTDSTWLYIGGRQPADWVACRANGQEVEQLDSKAENHGNYSWIDVDNLVKGLLKDHEFPTNETRLLLGRGVMGYGLELSMALGLLRAAEGSAFGFCGDRPVLRVPVTAVMNGALRVAGEPEMVP